VVELWLRGVVALVLCTTGVEGEVIAEVVTAVVLVATPVLVIADVLVIAGFSDLAGGCFAPLLRDALTATSYRLFSKACEASQSIAPPKEEKFALVC